MPRRRAIPLAGATLHLAFTDAQDGDLCVDAVLDGLERDIPALRGTIRDLGTGRRRPYMRYMACGRDLSHEPGGAPLPGPVAAGDEPLRLVGAISGG